MISLQCLYHYPDHTRCHKPCMAKSLFCKKHDPVVVPPAAPEEMQVLVNDIQMIKLMLKDIDILFYNGIRIAEFDYACGVKKALLEKEDMLRDIELKFNPP